MCWAAVATAVVMLLGIYYLLRFTLSRPSVPSNNKLIVVLDLDELLVHVNPGGVRSDVTSANNDSRPNPNGDGGIESFLCHFTNYPGLRSVADSNQTPQQQQQQYVSCQVFLRPGWKEFLEPLLSQPDRYEVHIFTASEPDYAKPILAELERRMGSTPNSNSRFAHGWYRDSCRKWIFHNQIFTFKDLSILRRPLHRTVLVDDDPTNFTDHPDHGIPVRPFQADDPTDDSLHRVARLLQELERLPDVRPLLRQKFGMAAAYREARRRYSFVPKQWGHVMNHAQIVQL